MTTKLIYTALSTLLLFTTIGCNPAATDNGVDTTGVDVVDRPDAVIVAPVVVDPIMKPIQDADVVVEVPVKE